jgi:hypothetical protein
MEKSQSTSFPRPTTIYKYVRCRSFSTSFCIVAANSISKNTVWRNQVSVSVPGLLEMTSLEICQYPCQCFSDMHNANPKPYLHCPRLPDLHLGPPYSSTSTIHKQLLPSSTLHNLPSHAKTTSSKIIMDPCRIHTALPAQVNTGSPQHGPLKEQAVSTPTATDETADEGPRKSQVRTQVREPGVGLTGILLLCQLPIADTASKKPGTEHLAPRGAMNGIAKV